jgi:hypothetical protein
LILCSQLALAQFTQQGPKLVGTSADGIPHQGFSVALSADGNTAILGAPGCAWVFPCDHDTGAAWVFTRTGDTWTQQGDKLVGTGAVGTPDQGYSFAISADGNTAVVGGPQDDGGIGAAWVFTRSGDVWAQQGNKLVGTGGQGAGLQGTSVALSADGNTAIVGGPGDNPPTKGQIGAAWVFTRSDEAWTQQGSKLVGTGYSSQYIPPISLQGSSVALSADGNTAVVGARGDGQTGAVWVFTRQNSKWTQQGNKLVGTGGASPAAPSEQGASVALSSDGNTLITGGPGPQDFARIGAVWVFTRSGGAWTQQGNALVDTTSQPGAEQGLSVALSADGNTAVVSDDVLGAWIYTRSSGVWTQPGGMLLGSDVINLGDRGASVALSADGITALVGAPGDNSNTGAAWVFVQPALQVAPATSIVASGAQGGPFAPGSFSYLLDATVGSFNYAISGIPGWLTPSATSGAASSGTTATFTVNASANALAPGTYGPATITFTNTDTGQGTQTRTATLTVNPQGPTLRVTPATEITAEGTHGGAFSPSSFKYTLSATTGSVNYAITTPSWLTASPKSGSVTTSPKSITITFNSSAKSLVPNTYVSSVNINNTTDGAGSTGLIAKLTVNPKDYKLTVSASPSADGSVTAGEEVPEGTWTTVTATPNSGFRFLQWTESGQQVSMSPSYTFAMPSKAITLTAHFQ